MKRILSILLCLAMLLTLSVGAMAETFEGTGKGFGGDIKVAVTVEDGKLTAIEVLAHNETAGISDAAFAGVPAAIIENQSVAVDTVAGCTFTSKGLIEAVTAAWTASGAALEDISREVVKEEVAKELETKTADVIVIGAGGAGMTAAVEVLRAGGSVLVVDKMASVGGFTASIANNIYVNKNGERFVAEDSRRDVLSGAVLAQPDSFFWLLTDAKTAWDLMGGADYNGNTVEQKKAQGLIEAETIEELAIAIGCDPATLQASIDQHNKAASGEEADPLGRQVYEYTFDKGPYYAGKGYAMVHHTMGGVEINENCEVLDANGNPIPGFYAAGEVTGGIHGANRLGGNAIADIIVFGQIAGQNAMK